MADFLFKDGVRMAIVRPDDAALALSKVPADGTPHDVAAPAFEAMLKIQPYTFMGAACRDQPRYFLNELGRILGRVTQGDSFTDFDALLRNGLKLGDKFNFADLSL